MITAFSTRYGWYLLGSALVLGVLAGFSGSADLPVPVPGLSTAPPAVPLPAIYAVLWVVVSIWCVCRGEMDWMKVAVRSVRVHSWGFTIVSGTLSVVAALAIATIYGDLFSALLYLRNILVFGLGSLMIWQLGFNTLAAVSPAIWVAICCLFARDTSGEIRWWAWSVNRVHNDPWAWGAATIFLAILLWRYRLSR